VTTHFAMALVTLDRPKRGSLGTIHGRSLASGHVWQPHDYQSSRRLTTQARRLRSTFRVCGGSFDLEGSEGTQHWKAGMSGRTDPHGK